MIFFGCRRSRRNQPANGGHAMDDKVRRASFSLEPDYVEKMKELAKRRRMNLTALLRLYIDQDAVELGVQPVAALPKVSTLALVMN